MTMFLRKIGCAEGTLSLCCLNDVDFGCLMMNQNYNYFVIKIIIIIKVAATAVDH